MSEKWPTKVNPKQKSLRGVATVRVNKTGVKVIFEDSPETIYDIVTTSAPDNVRAGKWFVSLSAKGDKMFGFSPVSGAFTCKFTKFAASKDQLPAPQHYTMNFTDKETGAIGISEYDAFTALLEIIDGPNAGLTIPYFLRYYLGEVEGVTALTKPKSKYSAQLAAFLEATGAFDKGTLTYMDNLLPAIEERLKVANRKLMVIMREGRVDAISAIE
jgi:hypothetical protein